MLPVLYSLFVRDSPAQAEERKRKKDRLPRQHGEHGDSDAGGRVGPQNGKNDPDDLQAIEGKRAKSPHKNRADPARKFRSMRWSAGDGDGSPFAIAISGHAPGAPAYSLLFRIANGGLFGPEQAVEISLLDLPERRLRLMRGPCRAAGLRVPAPGRRQARDGAGIGVRGGRLDHPAGRAAASVTRTQTRLDLLHENAPIMVAHGRAINRAAPCAWVLVVASPCNTNCRPAMTHAQDTPKEHWFALNQVFRMRAIALVAEKARRPRHSGDAPDRLGQQQRGRLCRPPKRENPAGLPFE